jgi:hypothetical protein
LLRPADMPPGVQIDFDQRSIKVASLSGGSCSYEA